MISKRWVIALGLAVGGCTPDFPGPVECGDDNNCLVKHSVDTLLTINDIINYWDHVNTASIILTVFFGIVATVMLALQGNENKYWTRPIGIIATALVTGTSTLISSFHIPETKDKYISAYVELINITNNFEVKVAETTDAKRASELRLAYAADFMKVKADILKTKGSLALINVSPQSLPNQPQSLPNQPQPLPNQPQPLPNQPQSLPGQPAKKGSKG